MAYEALNTREWCPLAVRMKVIGHHINVVHILIDFGDIIRKVNDSLWRSSGQTQQIGATLSLIFTSDFVK